MNPAQKFKDPQVRSDIIAGICIVCIPNLILGFFVRDVIMFLWLVQAFLVLPILLVFAILKRRTLIQGILLGAGLVCLLDGLICAAPTLFFQF